MSEKSSNDRRARAEQMRKERERAAKRRRNGLTVGIVAIVVVLVAVAGFGIYQATSDDAEAGSTPDGATADGGFVIDQEALTGESSNKDPVDVVLYEDFQCPACKGFETMTRSVVDQYIKDGTIQMEYRPLDFIDQAQGGQTDYSLRAANAAICTYEDGGAKAFYDLHKPFFDDQMTEGGPGFTDQQYADYASGAGVDGISSCISDVPYGDFVKSTTKDFLDQGFQGTPTILINGEELHGTTVKGQEQMATVDQLKAAIEKAAAS